MRENAENTVQNKVSAESEGMEMSTGGGGAAQFVDNRPETVAQRKVQEAANNSS
jgi:predicted nicotinamide N-methyase